MTRSSSPPRKVVAIDVDDVLISGGEVNGDVVEFARNMSARGFEVWVWSSEGQQEAVQAVERAEICDVVQCCLGKPGIIVEGEGWDWSRLVQVINYADDLDEWG